MSLVLLISAFACSWLMLVLIMCSCCRSSAEGDRGGWNTSMARPSSLGESDVDEPVGASAGRYASWHAQARYTERGSVSTAVMRPPD